MKHRPPARVAIPPARLETTIKALAFAAVRRYDSCLELLREGFTDDTYGELEMAFSIFVEDMAGAQRGLEAALGRYDVANRELEEKLATIERQQGAMRELSSPIIEVWSGVLCLPVVGIVDTQRSAEMGAALLDAIVARQVRLAIVDLTGVDVIDTKTADHFLKMARSVRLLGAECILTGIKPAVAQTLVHIGVDLTDLTTLRSLRDALQRHLPAARAGAAEHWEEAR
jgi:rsbT co-antagonist protein RsbR